MPKPVCPPIAADVIAEIGSDIVLIDRRNFPFGWALPGGFVDVGEKVEDAAVRDNFPSINHRTRHRSGPGPAENVSELRAAIDMDRIAGDPAGVVGGKEGDHAADVVRLGEALQGLHTERERQARIRNDK